MDEKLFGLEGPLVVAVFRWVAQSKFSVLTLKKFDDGHRSEDIVVERIREGGVPIFDKNSDGKQFGLSLFNGLFRGHLDGVIAVDTGKEITNFVFEAKCSDPRVFASFQNAKAKFGELALKEWNETYYAQAQMYSVLTGMDCLHVVSTSGSRDWDYVITRRDPEAFRMYVAKAKDIITSDRAADLPRLSNSPTWWKCNDCSFQGQCHYGDDYDKNCRTCQKVKVDIDTGQFVCTLNQQNLTYDQQRIGCDEWNQNYGL